MANILVTAGEFLEQGTSGDDAVTFEESVFTGAPIGPNVGNPDPVNDTGVDTVTLSMDDLAALAAAGVTYTAGVGWAFIGGDSFDDAFESFTTSDGETLVREVAWSEDIFTFDSTNGISGGGGITPFTADILGDAGNYTTAVSWDGMTLGSSDVDLTNNWQITAFDGNTIAAGGSASEDASDGFGQLTVDGAAGTLDFLPDTSSIAGLGLNIGSVVEFPYTVELTNSVTGDVQTITVNFSVTIDWTTGNDVLDMNDFPDENFDVNNGGASVIEGGAVGLTPVAPGSGLSGGDDLVIGNSDDNGVLMNAGNNTVSGAGGNDTLTGGIDDDLLRGGGGEDELVGGTGNDSLIGGNNNDTLIAADGDDNLLGGDGNDSLDGGGDNDFFRAGDGDDTLLGDTGNDTLKGGAGDDNADGGAGDDELHTSAGDNDILTGGAGSDNFILKAGTGNTEITDFARTDSDELDVTALGWTEAMFNNGDIEFYVLQDAGAVSSTVLIVDEDTTVTLTGYTGLGVTDFEFA